MYFFLPPIAVNPHIMMMMMILMMLLMMLMDAVKMSLPAHLQFMPSMLRPAMTLASPASTALLGSNLIRGPGLSSLPAGI